MTTDDSRQSLTATEPPAGLSLAGSPRAIGRGPTSRLSRTKAPRVVGCTLTCTAKEAMRGMRRTGNAVEGIENDDNENFQKPYRTVTVSRFALADQTLSYRSSETRKQRSL
jgi:hypothetical protein